MMYYAMTVKLAYYAAPSLMEKKNYVQHAIEIGHLKQEIFKSKLNLPSIGTSRMLVCFIILSAMHELL